MTKKTLSAEVPGAYAELLSLLERNLKFMVSIGLDGKRSADYQSLLSYLRSRTEVEIEQILGRQSLKKKEPADSKKAVPKTPPLDFTDAEILQIDTTELREKLKNGSLRRAILERIATVRFSMTVGALSTLRTRDALQEKLLNVLSNEDAHKSIARVVEGGQQQKVENDSETS